VEYGTWIQLVRADLCSTEGKATMEGRTRIQLMRKKRMPGSELMARKLLHVIAGGKVAVLDRDMLPSHVRVVLDQKEKYLTIGSRKLIPVSAVTVSSRERTESIRLKHRTIDDFLRIKEAREALLFVRNVSCWTHHAKHHDEDIPEIRYSHYMS